MRIFYVGLLCLLLPLPAHAWLTSENTFIDSIALWQDNEIMYFHVSAGFWCYIPADETNAKSLILAAYSSKNTVQIHCHDKEEKPMTFTPAHRFHRIIMK
jgi:hypothetical protein